MKPSVSLIQISSDILLLRYAFESLCDVNATLSQQQLQVAYESFRIELLAKKFPNNLNPAVDYNLSLLISTRTFRYFHLDHVLYEKPSLTQLPFGPLAALLLTKCCFLHSS